MGIRDIFLKQAPQSEVPKRPPVDQEPEGTSGRGHTAGFIDLEELNTDLQHPEGSRKYDKMYRTDGDVRQVVQLTVNPAIAGTWDVEPEGGEEASKEAVEHADFAKEVLWDVMEPNLLGHLTEFLPVLARTGFAPGEVAWKTFEWKGDTKIVPRTIQLRLPRTITQWEQDAYGGLTRIKQTLPASKSAVTSREDHIVETDQDQPGEQWLDRNRIVYYRIGAEGDNWEGTSLLRPAYKHWVYKDVIEKIDAIAQEREAVGIPICYPPVGATDEQLDTMEDILQSMRTNEEGYIIAPGPKSGPGMAAEGQGWLIEVIGYDRTGSGRDPQPSLEYHTQKIAAAFISEFMRLGHGQSGARATAQVQADPFLAAVEAFVSVVEGQLNKDIVRPLIAWNFPGVKKFPRLKMSLVDSTSLQQLADFVQKLTQVGALFPDQALEDFLRARADLPPADPAAVQKRKKQDDKLRREIVTGPPGMNQPGANARPGEHGTKPAPGMNPGRSSATNRGKKDGAHDTMDADVTLGYDYDADKDVRYRWRDPKWFELLVDLDGLEDELDGMPDQCVAQGREAVIKMARVMAHPSTPLGEGADRAELHTILQDILQRSYDTGAGHVADEIQRQLLPVEDESVVQFTRLDRGARDRGGALQARASIAADQVEIAMRHAMLGADLTSGNHARAQAEAEAAGLAALRRVGHQHGVSALLHGRHDQGRTLAEEENGIEVVGVRYSALLDRATCAACDEADDGVLRPLDDPVRLDRQPPNHHCHSTKGGFNQCRCFEVFEVMPPTFDPKLDAKATALPEFIQECAQALMDRGLDPARAIVTAQAIARSFCRTGKITWPGLSHLGLSRVEACDAAGWNP